MTHRGCTWWFDFTKSFDPRCLTGGHVHDVSSKMEGWLHFIMLPVPNTNTLDQTERLRACFTCGKLDKKTKKKTTQKSIVWNFANISYCAARLATTCVCFLRGNVAQQFVMEEGRKEGGRTPGTSHGKQSHFSEFGFDFMNSNVLLNWRWSSQPPIFFQLTAKGGSRATPRKSPLFKLFFFAVAHWWTPLGACWCASMCPKLYQYIKEILFCKSSKYGFLHPSERQHPEMSAV